MRQKTIRILVAVAFAALSMSFLYSDDNYKVLNGPKDFYYGHVSYIAPGPEGREPVVLRAGRANPEVATVNLPVGPGDVIRTPAERRLEIQFDTGTIVRLDAETEVKIETILARSLSALNQMSNLVLQRGRIYIMYKEYGSRETFQVLTANAAMKLNHRTIAVIKAAPDGSTEAQVKYGKARVLFGPNGDSLDTRDIKKGERLMILPDHQVQSAPAIQGTDFELWNDEVNARFDELHEGLTPLPKPVQKLPKAVFYFAQMYGNQYGEWLWDDLYGYVWRPFLDNGMYPWGWQPYVYGRWAAMNGQMFWVPQEPWGWVPYHLGIWQWDKKLGWVWLPGSLFAPAWADWDFYFGYASWRPWGLYDWMYDFGAFGSSFYDGSWLLGGPVTGSLSGVGPARRTVIRRDQLKQPEGSNRPIPAELRGVVKRVLTALNKGDERITKSVSQVSSHVVFAAKENLAAPRLQEKVLTWDKLPKVEGVRPVGPVQKSIQRPPDAQREAARILQRLESQPLQPGAMAQPKAIRRTDGTAAAPGPGPKPERTIRNYEPAAGPRTGGARPMSVQTRFHDWNPDVKIARELGVRIEYSSLRNEIRCPELRITSADRDRGSAFVPQMTSHGVEFTSSPSGNPSRESSSREGSSRGSSGQASGSSKGESGGKVKN